jgi:phospho-N-acetylmuramoyl-pentapeptide-transferase
VFIVTAFLFGKMNVENAIYLILVLAAMMTGFLDDCAKTPWGELKKGILDLVIAVMLAVTYLNFNTNKIYFASCNKVVALPEILFGVLIVILVWTSINVTNCSDGVDGLSGTLTIITLATIYVISILLETASSFTYLILLFIK